MKLPNFKTIFKTDFKEEDQDLIEKLGILLNYNISTLFNVFNKNITLTDNINGFIKDIEIVVDSNGVPTSSIKINSTLNPSRPTAAIVLNHENLTNSNIYPTGAIMISYTELAGVLTINHITGLQVNNLYRLKIMFFA